MAVIGIMDSGIGGLSVFKEIRKVLPNEDYIYYADTAFCPYGEKSPEFVRERCTRITELMLGRGVDIMVLACNTATAAAISYLRDTYNIPFIGMEPAIKPAALGTRSGIIGVLATHGTLNGSKYLDIRDKYSSDIKIIENVGRGFVEIVEKAFASSLRGDILPLQACSSSLQACEAIPSNPEAVESLFDNEILTSSETKAVVAASLNPLLEAGADTIVLGCTHYPFLLYAMRTIADSSVHFIDPAPAVAAHLVEVLNNKGIALNANEGSFEFLSSKN